MPITRRTVDHGASMAQYFEDQRSATQPLSHDPYAALEPKPEYLINVLSRDKFSYNFVYIVPSAYGLQNGSDECSDYQVCSHVHEQDQMPHQRRKSNNHTLILFTHSI